MTHSRTHTHGAFYNLSPACRTGDNKTLNSVDFVVGSLSFDNKVSRQVEINAEINIFCLFLPNYTL